MTRRQARRAQATDDAGLLDFYAPQQIGVTQSLTPEGFLLCTDVPLARTGEMLYGPGEVPVEPGRDGIIRVTRDADELFSAKTLASFNGKPVVNDHPDEDVTSDNWDDYAVGVMFNIRRGTAEDSDVMLGDLLITKKSAIRDVRSGKRELSLGYDADYEDLGDGRGRQTDIIGNHGALVDRGRCGPRCAIGDQASTKEKQDMATKAPRRALTIQQRVRKVFHDAADAIAEELTESGIAPEDDMGDDDTSGGVHVHIHGGGASTEPPAKAALTGDEPQDGSDEPAADPGAGGDMGARIDALEAGHTKILEVLGTIQKQLSGQQQPTGDAEVDPEDLEFGNDLKDGKGTTKDEADPPVDDPDDKAGKTMDSAPLETGFKAMVADAEILVPGIKVATFDAKLNRKATIDSMCKFRRRALTLLGSTQDGTTLLETVTPGFDVDSADCKVVATTFRTAAAAKKISNQQQATRDAHRTPGGNTGDKPKSSGISVARIAEQFKQAYPEA